ncbi:unnamed protein product [Enterobius vermicularis]|uniref:50S ribosomal protein L35 n=1 Tax=Enterobius vermicularis TaxID=51028 RepID=A0A0N4VJP1_ENTVE|nr:unnamed protein product [Enterobius vermicularis]
MAKKRTSLKNSRQGASTPNAKHKRTQQGGKMTFKKGAHSLNPDRIATGPHMRSRATINRLRMYKNFKPIR